MQFTLEKIFREFESTETWILDEEDKYDVLSIFGTYNDKPLVKDTKLAIIPQCDDGIEVLILGEGKNKILELSQVLQIVDFFEILFHNSTSKECLIKDVWGIETRNINLLRYCP